MSDPFKDPLAIALVAQRTFNHQLLLRLIEAGVMTQSRAAAVAAETANFLRDIDVAPKSEPFRESLSRGFEQIAAGMLGMRPIP
jgi:hypothetical protein